MDIQMPLMNGIEAAKKIREKETSGSHTPVIAITAYALQGDRERFLALGMDEYITKPIEMNVLFDTIERIADPGVKASVSEEELLEQINHYDIKQDNKITIQPGYKTDQILYSISRDIEQLEKAIEYNDLLKTESFAHDMKALAGIIDAEELKDDAFRIELASRRGNLEEASKYIKKIKTEFMIYGRSQEGFTF
jgi:response regulator RpfG family c-di-GMP phosphodiesterase